MDEYEKRLEEVVDQACERWRSTGNQGIPRLLKELLTDVYHTAYNDGELNQFMESGG